MEEEYVLVELNGIVENDWLSKIGEKCKFLGLDTENPFLQLGPYIFQGEYEDAVGTAVVFEEHEEGKGLKYKCNTHKKLVMQRSFLKQKDDGQSTSHISEEDEIDGKIDNVSSGDINKDSETSDVSDSKVVDDTIRPEQQRMEIDNG